MRGEDSRFLPPTKQARSRAPQPEPPETVDPSWILKALGAVVALGLLCSYVTLCAFFYAGQWQFVLHPSRTVSQTPASQQLTFEPVRFGVDVAGRPQLAGWWMPSDLPSDPTILMLHSETGSMADALPAAKALHDARLNVLLFDYRGYGQSEGRHPSQAMMSEDAREALRYVTDARKVPAGNILLFGQGLGASLATTLCQQRSDLPGLILVDADGDTLTRVELDQRSRIVPIGLLFHERFPLSDPLHTLRMPKLLVSHTAGVAPVYAQRAADPKVTAELGSKPEPGALTLVVRRFLDTYLTTPAPALTR